MSASHADLVKKIRSSGFATSTLSFSSCLILSLLISIAIYFLPWVSTCILSKYSIVESLVFAHSFLGPKLIPLRDYLYAVIFFPLPENVRVPFAMMFVLIFVFFLYDSIKTKQLRRKIISLRNKRVLICGASTGIARDLAHIYASIGCHVGIVARRENLLEEVKSECLAMGAPSVTTIVADFSQEQDCIDVIEKFPDIDILVLNHIIGYFDNMAEVVYKNNDNNNIDNTKNKKLPLHTLKFVENIINVNYLSFVHLAIRALPVLQERKGQIIVVSSLAGRAGLPYVAPYAASKHALCGFFDSLRLDLSLPSSSFHDVSITIATLGNIDTEGNRAGTEGKLSTSLKKHPSLLCAAAIVEGAAIKEREVYYPFIEVFPAKIFNAFFPSFFGKIVISSMGLK